jgi:hypothetical protein
LQVKSLNIRLEPYLPKKRIKSYWASERAETNTGNLTISQITLLTDSNHSNICTSLKNTYQEALEEKNELGEPALSINLEVQQIG